MKPTKFGRRVLWCIEQSPGLNYGALAEHVWMRGFNVPSRGGPDGGAFAISAYITRYLKDLVEKRYDQGWQCRLTPAGRAALKAALRESA